MLDVHSPHQSVHTWKDVLIHIGIIAVGLLIAIGLEQTVEAIHHAHERRELIADIHSECTSNLQIFANNRKSLPAARRWHAAAIAALEEAKPTGGLVTVILPPFTPGDMQPPRAPSRAVWTLAQSNGKAALLPEKLAEVFTSLDRAGENFQHALERSDANDEIDAALYARFRMQPVPGATLHLTPAERDEIAASVSLDWAYADSLARRSAYWGSACRAVLDGVQTRDEMFNHISSELNKVDSQ